MCQFFCFPLAQNPFVNFFSFVFLRPKINPIILLWARSTSIYSLTPHLSDLKPSPSPSISDQKPSLIPPSPIQNPRLTLHRRSHPHPHPHPPSPISPSTLASRSISDLHRHPPRQQQRVLRDPSKALASASRPISGFGFCFETHLALSILLALPKTPTNSVTNCESFSFFFFLKLVWLYGCFFF